MVLKTAVRVADGVCGLLVDRRWDQWDQELVRKGDPVEVERVDEPRPTGLAVWLAAFRDSVAADVLVKVVMGRYRGSEPELKKVTAKPAEIRGEAHLSFVWQYRTRDVTRNLPVEEGIIEVERLLETQFHTAHLLTGNQDVHAEHRGKKGWVVSKGASLPRPLPDKSLNREKKRWLDSRMACFFGLGLTRPDGGVLPSMSHKWKQVNKFAEIVDSALRSSSLNEQNDWNVVDFGSGKGYLTFALHSYLSGLSGHSTRVTGVELRPELVDLCNRVAAESQLERLSFVQGSIETPPDIKADMLVALHACDTATDKAMFLGISRGASLILCSPCCHKEIRPQMKSPPVLAPVLRFGVHEAREAEMVTDAMRALLLEAWGYKVQIQEFISLEHTDKNCLVSAVRVEPDPRRRRRALEQLAELKAFYGIREQHLETLLNTMEEPS
jgi:hypothetical protein